MMRDRADFINNLKESYTHLLILTEDIKYPLSEERQKWLDGATLLVEHLHREMMKEDIEAALTEKDKGATGRSNSNKQERKGSEHTGKDTKEQERLQRGHSNRLFPLYVETKSKRLQLVVQPSLYERIKAASDAAGLSVNEFCHRVLDKATEEEREG